MEFDLINRFHSLLLQVDMNRHQVEYFGKNFEVFHVQPHIFMKSNLLTVLLTPMNTTGVNWWAVEVTSNEDLQQVCYFVDDFTKQVNIDELIQIVCDIEKEL